MQQFEKWMIHDTMYRGSSEQSFSQGLSCGFLDKSGKTEDVSNEHYDRLAMVYVLRGSGGYQDSQGYQCELHAGDVFFRFPDRSHSSHIEADSQWHECFVSLRSEWYHIFQELELIRPDQVRLPMGIAEEIPTRIHGLMDLMRAADTPTETSSLEFEIAALIRRVLASAQANRYADTPHADLLKRAREIIRTQAALKCSIETLLAELGLSYSRLRSLFRAAYNISPGEFRIQVRIENACSLLETTDLPIKKIADQLGYADAFSFSKQFKQRVALSPQQFRSR
ncbi:helix-turn-helix domain-containing protein [Coraliomargarita sp. SDUM461003]|uniref:Helix-turn-helix domain-containing protein n=1 Tax=Thalassobacterium maritimum TaxID=3041265 RepID=A0ABU1ARC9_9BACT|nr:helix-turn-helix domain-containing protein [Coraliomargarita sp. SDUM461003]MDQ8206712.1 helix-turn-helix domain-containing protein [Coraliomargarita sp. SDUM461003]